MTTKHYTLIAILVILAGLVIYMVSARMPGPNMPGQPAPHAIDQTPPAAPTAPAAPAPATPAPAAPQTPPLQTPAPQTPAPQTPAPQTP